MKKIIASTLALYMLSLTAYAATGKNYRILDESIKSTPGFKFKVEPSNNEKKSKLNKRHIQSLTEVTDKIGKVNQNVYIEGRHQIHIDNATGSSQIYEYTYTLNCDESRGLYVRHVEIDNHGYFDADDHTFGVVQKSSPGTYSIFATTKVTGENELPYEDQGWGTLTVNN